MEGGNQTARVPVICPVRNAGNDPFGDRDAKTWPWIVFQVFWSPSGGCPFPGDTVVLLGEAFAPPLNTIPGQRTPLCLKLQQTNRRPPNNCKPYEDWLTKIWPEFQDRVQRELNLTRNKDDKKKEKAVARAEKQMKAELETLANDLAKETEESGHGYTEHNLYTPEELIMKAFKEESNHMHEKNRKEKCQPPKMDLPSIRLADGTVARAPQRPQRLSTPRTTQQRNQSQYNSEIGVHDSNLCFVDVDVAWTENPNAECEDELGVGSLMIYSLSVRVPPCNEGQVRIRVAELESVATAALKPAVPHDFGATDTSSSLCAEVMERDARVTPIAPAAHPLWESRERMLGKGDMKSFCDWGTEAFVKLWVTPCDKLKNERRRNMINDVIRPCLPPKRPPLERREVGFTYTPVQMKQPTPMPRTDFCMMPGALFEPPARMPATEGDFVATPPRRVGGDRSGTTPATARKAASPASWVFDTSNTEGDRRPLESRTPRGTGRAGNTEGMSAPLFRSTPRGGRKQLIGDAAFLQSTGGRQQLRNW